MNNNILLTVPLATAPLLLAVIAQLALLLALFLTLIIVVVIVDAVLQSILLSCLLHDYFMVQKHYLHRFFCAASLLLHAVGSLFVLLIGSRCKPVSNTYLNSAIVVSLDCMYQCGAHSTHLK
jgi:hypothetical protein